ncbi:MAG: right-handed parallel beta-helix repeat-containing protein [Phycisphaerales bacterium]|nr:right-handed parallel beta-helix repeat-containing protein [Phycisphaerales bacterium]
MRRWFAFLCLMLSIPAMGDDLLVPGQFASLQAAIDAAVNGDTVILADGVYTGVGFHDIDLGGRAITVRSANGPNACVINLEHTARGFVLQSGETRATRIEGLTIENGLGDGAGIRLLGVSSATVVNCVFRNHNGVDGAAAIIERGDPIFQECRFEDNFAANNGGAVITGPGAMFLDCRFARNQAMQGGAIHGAPIIDGCVFAFNEATEPDSTGGAIRADADLNITRSSFVHNGAGNAGGAIHFGQFRLRAIDSSFVDNFAVNGGAAFGGGVDHEIIHCDFIRNQASNGAGALHFELEDGVVERCVFRGNTGGELGAAMLGGTVRDCAFFGNESQTGDGGALSLGLTFGGPTSSARDCVFAGNRADFGGGALRLTGNTADVAGCVFSGNSARFGGAIRNGRVGAFEDQTPSSLRVTHSVMCGNMAESTGAAVVMGRRTPTGRSTIVAHSLIAGNLAAGVDWEESAAALAGVTSQGPRLEVYNSTVADNASPDLSAGVYDAYVYNSIVWRNRGIIGATESAQITLSNALEHSCVQSLSGPLVNTGNTDADPRFLREASGAWTANADFEPNAFVVRLTDADARWRVNKWAGAFVRPDVNEPFVFQILSNDADTLTIWADWPTASTGIARWTTGRPYQLIDYHIAESSSCVDAGDNARARADVTDIDADDDTTELTPFDLAGDARFVDILSRPNTGVEVDDYPELVDIGAYEYQGCPNDVDGDLRVGLGDLAQVISAFGRTRPVTYHEGDVTGDGSVDLRDLAEIIATYGEACD